MFSNSDLTIGFFAGHRSASCGCRGTVHMLREVGAYTQVFGVEKCVTKNTRHSRESENPAPRVCAAYYFSPPLEGAKVSLTQER